MYQHYKQNVPVNLPTHQKQAASVDVMVEQHRLGGKLIVKKNG